MTRTPAVRSPAVRLAWGALALVCLLAAAAAVVLWQLRRDTLRAQHRELNLLALAFSDEIDRGLQGAEEGLRAVRAGWVAGRLAPSGPDAERSLRLRAELMPQVRTLWLVDAGGRTTASSDASRPPPMAAFAPAPGALPPDGTALSTPFPHGPDGANHVALAVRVPPNASGAGGWVVAALPASTLLGAFNAASTLADARMAVYRSDGVRLAGAVPDERPGHLARRHHVAHFALEVVLTRDLAPTLAAWRESVQITAVALALLLATLAVSLQVVQRADRRRAEAQQALQQQRARASKLESLGTLAGGVAHDFNNVLAAIVGFGEMAQDEATPGSDQARHLDRVLQAAARGRSLVQRILAFSRGGAHASRPFELQPVVEEVLTLLAASLRPGVLLERQLQAAGAHALGDATRAFEAVMNLCTNAMQAMPQGGTMGVHLARVQTTAPTVLSHAPLPAGRWLALTVSDQGVGMDAAVMERLFEPFFTTRADQDGTGLGLAVVHGVVSELGGAVNVASAPGQGARFTLYLPECAGPAEAAPPVQRATDAGAGQEVLVVDDEPALVEWMVATLTALGYRPVGFTDPQAALQAVLEAPLRFAALVTDEVMPGLDGTRLASEARRAAPGLPVLLVSGHGGALLAQRAVASGIARVLGKPVRRAELATAIAALWR